MILGNQCKSDNVFTKKARLLQSLYRVELNEDEGYGPYKSSKNKYGNMLNNGENSGKNFFLPETFHYAKERVENKKPDETIDDYRLFNNLMSSMPMTFNLFHPLMLMLAKEPQKTSQVLSAAFNFISISEVKEIGIEFIPTPIEKYTGDKSAMDAYIKYIDDQGKLSLLAIEMKYTDSLGVNTARNADYQKKLLKETGVFISDLADKLDKNEVKITQIYRNILLTERCRMTDGYANSNSVVIAPKDHPSTKKEIESVSRYLKKEYTNKLCSVSLESFVEALIQNSSDFYRDVFERFQKRYLAFERIADYL